MILPDVNVLIYAFRQDAPHHTVCRPWLAEVIQGDARFGLSPLALSALVRITTNPRSFRNPSSFTDAFGFCRDLMGQLHCQIVEPGERIFSSRSVSSPTPEDHESAMRGLPPSPSSGIASGLHLTGIMRDSPA